jgi:cysteine synthase A
MTNIYDSIDQVIGNTPLVRLNKSAYPEGFEGEILLKLESLNPAGSVKDRIGKAIIDRAEEEGVLKEGGTIVEASSGNTGIALASVGSSRGYRVVLTMPDTMTEERRALLKAYGAELVLTPGDDGILGAIAKANEIAEETEGAFVASQFENKVNPEIHYKTTGPEIWEDTDGEVDILVSGIGTGGTITGAGKYLKEQKESVEMIAVEPAGSPLLAKGETGKHKIQGIGAGIIPEVLDQEIYSEIILVKDEDAFSTGRTLGTKAGIFTGISAGAALWAALEVAARDENKDETIVVIMPDNGDRYLSMEGFIKE